MPPSGTGYPLQWPAGPEPAHGQLNTPSFDPMRPRRPAGPQAGWRRPRTCCRGWPEQGQASVQCESHVLERGGHGRRPGRCELGAAHAATSQVSEEGPFTIGVCGASACPSKSPRRGRHCAALSASANVTPRGRGVACGADAAVSADRGSSVQRPMAYPVPLTRRWRRRGLHDGESFRVGPKLNARRTAVTALVSRAQGRRCWPGLARRRCRDRRPTASRLAASYTDYGSSDGTG